MLKPVVLPWPHHQPIRTVLELITHPATTIPPPPPQTWLFKCFTILFGLWGEGGKSHLSPCMACNKPFSAPNSNVLVCLASLCIGHLNFTNKTSVSDLVFFPFPLFAIHWTAKPCQFLPTVSMDLSISIYGLDCCFLTSWCNPDATNTVRTQMSSHLPTSWKHLAFGPISYSPSTYLGSKHCQGTHGSILPGAPSVLWESHQHAVPPSPDSKVLEDTHQTSFTLSPRQHSAQHSISAGRCLITAF